MPVKLEAVGHAAPFSSVAIRSQVSGVLEGVYFKEGDLVRAGQLMFTIDSRPFKDALARAKSDLAKDLGYQKQAASEQAENEVLLRSKVVSRDSYNESAATADSLKAAVQADKAAVDLAELELSYCQIHAPIEGRAGFLQVNPGNIIPTGEAVLVTVNQTRPIFVDFPIPEESLPAIRHAASCGSVKVLAGFGQHPSSWAGELTAIDNAVDENTHAVLLRARFANEQEVVWPGQTVNILMELPTMVSAMLVPLDSVQNEARGQFVFVVNSDEIVESRQLETGERVGNSVIAYKGLQAGDRVVTHAQKQLGPGIKVRIL